MNIDWNDSEPIYLQLKERLITRLLNGEVAPGEAIPSVRQVAAEYQLNPLTVGRTIQELADEGVIEKRRGMGMYLAEGAVEKLLKSERDRFLHEEWPKTVTRMRRLGFEPEQLLAKINKGGKK